jgi:hypothetical protein
VSRAFWTAERVEVLTARYPNEKTEDVARILGCTVTRIYNKVHALKIRKSAEFLREVHGTRLKELPGGVANRFKKGGATWNKGMKGLDIGGKETRFKKGQKPQTWRPVGSERVDKNGYLKRKISDTGVKKDDWVLVHIHVWTQAHGPLPPNHAVVFKDGDKRNFALDNLEAISRVDLMKRNTVHNYPPEIAKACQLLGALRRKINGK